MNDGEAAVATPGLGLAKGIIAILVGVMSSGGLFVIALLVGFAATVEPWYGISGARVAMIIVAFLLPPISFGLCLWRGIVAIRRRRVRRVTRLNFGLWLALFVLVCTPGVLAAAFLGPVLQSLLPAPLSQWWLWAIVAVAVGTGVWLKRRSARAKQDTTSTKIMEQPDRRVPAQDERAAQDSGPVTATPGLGLAKGIIAILLGVLAGIEVALVGLVGNLLLLAMTNNPWYDYHGREVWANYSIMITGAVIGLVIFGLCLWRGIVAIRRRKSTRVTHFNFGLWLGFFVVACVPVVLIALLLSNADSLSVILPPWWMWVALAVAAIAVGTGIWLKRRSDKSQDNITIRKRLLAITGACIVVIITVAVVFTHLPKPQYDLSIDSTAGGSIATIGAGVSTHDKGSVVVLVARPDPGYRFAGWSGDVGTVSNVNSSTTAVTIDSNYCITANFEPGYAPMIAAGYHTVGLKSDGRVVAVGDNLERQCEIANWTDIVQVAAGRFHTLGLKSDGTVVAVGWNEHGQCDVSGWTDIVQVAGGFGHTVGLKSDGAVVTVGSNDGGLFEVGDWTAIVQVAAGSYHTVGLRSDGSVVAVGHNDHGQCDVGGWSDVIQVSAGGGLFTGHTVGLKSDGTILAVGNNQNRQCNIARWADIVQVSGGFGHTVGLKSNGTVVAVGNNDDGQCNVGNWTDIVQVAAGGGHTVGLKSDGAVVAVGDNHHVQCFVGDWTGVVQIANSEYHTVRLGIDGSVVAAGLNNYGQCNVEDWTDIVQVWAGQYHTAGLKPDGTVVAVGSDRAGQCNVEDWTDIVQVAAGDWHTAGLKSDGTVIAVGLNDYGQCDVGGWTDIAGIAAGKQHTIGIEVDGTAVAVGCNQYGQCDVGDWTDIVQVAASYSHTVGLKSDGAVVAVGYNYRGQCNVGDWTDIVQITVGGAHTVGLKSDGTVVAVGYNRGGQCNVGDWTDIVQVAAGGHHTVGLKSDGTVVATGLEVKLEKWNLLEATV